MNIKVDWTKVVEVEPSIEEDNTYAISIVFDDGTVCTYGYSDKKKFLIDYNKILWEEVYDR